MAAIAVGTGRLGVVSGLHDFDEFIDQTSPQRDAYVTLKPVIEVEDWAVHSGDTYVSEFSFTYKGVKRDIVGVKTGVDMGGLARVESLAECVATAGTFFFDVEEEFSGVLGSWDDSQSVWQIATWAFDGTNDYLLLGASLEGTADGKTGAVHGWFKTSAEGAEQVILTNTGETFKVALTSGGNLEVSAENAAGTDILTLTSTNTLNDGNWHHFVASWDLAASTGELYIDRVDVKAGGATITNDTIDYTVANWSVGATVAGGSKFNGELGQLWLDLNLIDITNVTNLDKFIKATNSMPTDLEQDGSGPTGSSPILFLNNSYNILHKNNGTGGDFEEQGDVTVGLTTPVNPSGAMLWDQFNKLYIHQSDGTNPNNTTVVAVHAFYFANKGTWQPSLGEDKLTNGGFESNEFDNSTDPTGWTKVVDAGSPTLTRGTTSPKQGDQYPVFTFPGAATETIRLHQSITVVDTAYYRVSGWYFSTDGVTASVGIVNSGDTDSLVSNGRDLAGSLGYLDLDNTNGGWRRFVLDFRADSSLSSPKLVLRGTGASTEGTVRFDGIKLQRIFRYNFYEPRLTAASLPPVETSSSDIFFGGKSIGSGSVSVINSDGLMEELIAEMEWMNQDALIDVGGTFRGPTESDFQEIDQGDFFRQMTGLIQSIEVTDEAATFELQDQRIFFHQILPPRIYDDEDFPNMDLELQGQVRPLWFGVKSNISPNRINTTASDYGVYELADCSRAPNGIKAISKVYAYLDKDSADRQLSTNRLELSSGTDYSEDLANGQFTLLRDVGPYLVDSTNQNLDYDEGGGGEVNATLTPGLYTATTLATEIQTQLNAAGDSDWTVSYSNSTHLFTIAKTAGTGNLLANTGTNKESGPWKLIGFKTNTDYSVGGGSQEGDDETFENSEKDHILRVSGTGFKDDGSGTFTGTADASIEIGADILRTLAIQWLDKPSSIIDETSFQFARDRAPESLAIYLNEATTTRDIFDRLEFSNIANIIIDGSGKLFIKVYVGTVPSNIKILNDADFQQFTSGRATNEVFTRIKVLFDRNPTTGQYEARDRQDDSVTVRLGRPEIKEIETYVKLGDNAISVAARMLELASTAPRKLEGTVLGSKMMRLEVGDKFQITRRRALAKGGQIRDEVFRIISISKSALTGKVTFSATDDRVTVASQACVTTCQSFCESTCQTTCEQSCQETCELNCQQACESSCQEACQIGCQETCQIGCQTTCEVNCQETCQLSCQGACEGGGCQTNCQNNCQTSCELNCQSACQSGCQTVCQTTSCQQTCQQSCQQTCEQSCQTTCQTSCQQTCELNCQSQCQTSCQSACQNVCQTVSEIGEI